MQIDWPSVNLDFANYLKKTKHANNSKKKLTKRKYEEAKDLFFEFWKTVKDEIPVSVEDISPLREEILTKVQNGSAPATALADVLKTLIAKGKISKDLDSGYVYVGEYVDAESNEPLFDYLKIGYTTDIDDRAKSLSGGVSSPLKFNMKHVWRFKPGYAYVVEQYLHGEFHDYRQMGEFFTSMDGLIEEWASDIIANEFSDVSESVGESGNFALKQSTSS
ncbi:MULTISPECIES: GIY-YIG nuclease family protein [unclassified Oleiphilus]|uniref:GIY-YIG nuclease family protein n=1 Tax=unclassified Oleiphilus TaxID=2631174 RepID=UPI0007C302DD|nr:MULTISPECIES: GIY-YIG nuclease family protein [unclassified Oleiphilus]KZY29751.1 hypothetical protein A3729_22010 [Oleiphilus sp. HI0043]KZY29760.1 hypothetical protein A3729_11785 [Oleiphilus sp. HI0043]KZZ67582.1 hypothetical protein A3763_15820 [Oleiphilus sp. HI0128]